MFLSTGCIFTEMLQGGTGLMYWICSLVWSDLQSVQFSVVSLRLLVQDIIRDQCDYSNGGSCGINVHRECFSISE